MAPTKIRCLVVHPGPEAWKHCAIQFHKDYNIPQRYVQSMTTLNEALQDAKQNNDPFDLIFMTDRIPYTLSSPPSSICPPEQTIRMVSFFLKRTGHPSVLVFQYKNWEWVEAGIADMHAKGVPWVYIHPDDTDNMEWWFTDFHGYSERTEETPQDAAAKLKLYNKLQLGPGEEVASETDKGWLIMKDGENVRYIVKNEAEVAQ